VFEDVKYESDGSVHDISPIIDNFRIRTSQAVFKSKVSNNDEKIK
jgi:hypothetical protein